MFNFQMNMPYYLMAFYGSIMILAVLLLRVLLKNKLPKFVFPVLWAGIILRLLIPFSLSSPLSMRVPELFMASPFMEAFAEDSIAVENTVAGAVAGTDSAAAPVPVFIAEKENPSNIMQVTETVYSGTDIAVHYMPYRTDIVYNVLLFSGFAGIFITAGILFFQKCRYAKRLKGSLLIEHNETVNTLLRDMDMGHILVFTNDEIASPLACGLLAPKIYLPTRIDFSNTELLSHILCHETMHIRRKDNWVKFAMLITLCAHWYNPLVWIMAKCLASDLESACDEAVLRQYDNDESRKSYAFSLLTMAITGNHPALLYSAFSKTEVEKRIQNIVHYRKASAFLLTFSVCLVLSSSIAFATGGQAPFQTYLSSFCSSSASRWGVRASLARGISLGENAEKRASLIIFDVLAKDATNDPDILENNILTALADEFHVEKSAFTLDISLCLNREDMFAEYAKWGLNRKNAENDMMLYNGETIRTYSDKMLGRYFSQPEGDVDITIVRNRIGDITSVTALHEGDAEFDRRTQEIEQNSQINHGITENLQMQSAVTGLDKPNDTVEELP
ncbi:MAG: M56 family metallopeptidase [Lachnospiraceae bacterium]|nr:M56 family metallopeptidase [Lachnospiraceae bacterium]